MSQDKDKPCTAIRAQSVRGYWQPNFGHNQERIKCATHVKVMLKVVALVVVCLVDLLGKSSAKMREKLGSSNQQTQSNPQDRIGAGPLSFAQWRYSNQ